MKKVYVSPEFELLKFRLTGDVLTSSFENSQGESAGGDLDDPFNPFDF